ncbi:phosphoribosyltransferase-like protein [Multifurca ochricompacta]|uniref:adenine phosphoribosyltransferase n=1 Tax=Multifurca ochricompacta TaxID=376703 RepID=A0AAD4M690_9AGAM|nr:phosphoribosyltransferase-like protein [Multifurca ochricompacta]
MSDVIFIKSFLKIHPDFPKKGVSFCDIFPLFRDPLAFEALIEHFVHRLVSHTIPNSPNKKIDVIVGLDARGFLLGPVLALKLGTAFVPVRKRGKLPGECMGTSFEKEYGTDELEMQVDAIMPGQTVVVVDDIIATGGSAAAAGELVTKQGGNLLEYLFIGEVDSLKGSAKLNAPTYSMIQFD